MLTRETIIGEGIDRCLTEMYEKAQPSVNLKDYLEQKKRGELDESVTPVHDRHYLSNNQFLYILDKYKEAFRCVNEWKSNIDFLVSALKEGGYRTVYRDNTCTAEKTPILERLIGKENADKVFELIEQLKDFYHFDRDEEKLSVNVALGCSPTSNAETVRNYWKSQGIDIEIDDTEYTQSDYWEIDMYGHRLVDEDDEDLESS